MHSHKNPMFPFGVATIQYILWQRFRDTFSAVKLEKSIQICLSLLPNMSQSLLWSFVFMHFLRGGVGFLHTSHSLWKGHITIFLSFLVLLDLREGDAGCQIANGSCKKTYWNWMTKNSQRGALMAEGSLFWVRRWEHESQINPGGRRFCCTNTVFTLSCSQAWPALPQEY